MLTFKPVPTLHLISIMGRMV